MFLASRVQPTSRLWRMGQDLGLIHTIVGANQKGDSPSG